MSGGLLAEPVKEPSGAAAGGRPVAVTSTAGALRPPAAPATEGGGLVMRQATAVDGGRRVFTGPGVLRRLATPAAEGES